MKLIQKRITTGFGSGAFCLVSPLYIVEISEAKFRGSLTAIFQVQVTLGSILVQTLNINEAVHWHIISGICIVPPVLMAIQLFFLPDSPYFLLTKSQEEAASKALEFLRNPGSDLEKEMLDLKIDIKNKEEIGTLSPMSFITDSVYCKPLIITLMLMFFQQFCGINAVSFYTQTIFIQAGTNMDIGETYSQLLISLKIYS